MTSIVPFVFFVLCPALANVGAIVGGFVGTAVGVSNPSASSITWSAREITHRFLRCVAFGLFGTMFGYALGFGVPILVPVLACVFVARVFSGLKDLATKQFRAR